MHLAFFLLVPLLLLGLLSCLILREVYRRNLQSCLGGCLFPRGKQGIKDSGQEVHLILCVADHYEPKQGNASRERALSRVRRWVEEYPRHFEGFRDSDGRTPRHSFFYPIEQYEPELLDELAGLCRRGFGEVEVHLHHDQDSGDRLRADLIQFTNVLAERHGLLARDRVTGATQYGFIHGNWALCNVHGNGKYCGVNEELDILLETGCYADFTMPSAPGIGQIAKVNRLYYAKTIPGQSGSHASGIDVGAGAPPAQSLLLIQGPLVLDWNRRKWGLIPGLENGCIQDGQPATIARLDSWLRAAVQVPSRPDWYFVKLYAHGAPEQQHEALLGNPMIRFHEDLAKLTQRNSHFHYHYVSAREMYNLVKAAENNWTGSVADALDYQLTFGDERYGLASSPANQKSRCP